MQKTKNIWPIDESAGIPFIGWQGWPGNKKFALVITHDVETRKGLEKSRSLAEIDLDYGFKSSFNIVPHKYIVPTTFRWWLQNNGFEVGVHDYNHDGKLYRSKPNFDKRATYINECITEWNALGFRSASMHHNLDWISNLNILYDSSTFDTDPFEPQPDGVNTIFPFWYLHKESNRGYVEVPYTLPQDFTLFILMKEKSCRIWKEKINWIASKGGMAMFIVHPDYINFKKSRRNKVDEYHYDLYTDFLQFIKSEYKDNFWNPLPHELAYYIIDKYVKSDSSALPNTSMGRKTLQTKTINSMPAI